MVIEYVPIALLIRNPRNARRHSRKQTRQIARSLRRFGFINPIIEDKNGVVIAGHGRLSAAELLGMTEVPVLRIEHLTGVEKRAYVLADNKLAEKAGWDREILAIELGELSVLLPEIDLDITDTGFEIGEIDQIIADRADPPMPKGDEIEDESIPATSTNPVTRRGDLWLLGPHKIGCGDARVKEDVESLMQGEKASMAFLDPPYNVPIDGHVQGRGVVKHAEFAFASGEMTKDEFINFLKRSCSEAALVSANGALHFICMDWRHIGEVLSASESCYSTFKNLCVWEKSNPGLGSLYRSQHELVFVFKVGDEPHRNAVELGRHGRNRSNIWKYPGANSFKAGGREELAWHPTVKPVALVADAMRDCTVKGEIVLDTFLGSGTTLIAAERSGRRCRGLEFEPKYVDVAIRRWQAWTKLEAVCATTGKTFDEIAAERAATPSEEPSSVASSTAIDTPCTRGQIAFGEERL